MSNIEENTTTVNIEGLVCVVVLGLFFCVFHNSGQLDILGVPVPQPPPTVSILAEHAEGWFAQAWVQYHQAVEYFELYQRSSRHKRYYKRKVQSLEHRYGHSGRYRKRTREEVQLELSAKFFENERRYPKRANK